MEADNNSGFVFQIGTNLVYEELSLFTVKNTEMNARTKVFGTAEAFIRFIQNVNHIYPTVIIVDYKVGGKRLLKFLKQHEQYKNVPILVYSKNLSDQQRNECIALGASVISEKDQAC